MLNCSVTTDEENLRNNNAINENTNNGINKGILQDRLRFRESMLSQAGPWYRTYLTRLYDRWEVWNSQLFDSELAAPPYILLANPHTLRAYGVTVIQAHSAGSDTRPSVFISSDTSTSATSFPPLQSRLDPGIAVPTNNGSLVRFLSHDFI